MVNETGTEDEHCYFSLDVWSPTEDVCGIGALYFLLGMALSVQVAWDGGTLCVVLHRWH